MYRSVLFIAFILVLSAKAFSQDLDTKLLTSVCAELLDMNKAHQAKEKLQGIYILEDPVTGDRFVQCDDSLKIEYKDFLRQNSKEEQIRILTRLETPNLPLKDTVLIIDTQGLIQTDFSVRNEHYFQLCSGRSLSCSPNKKNISYLFLYRIAIRKNMLFVSFSFKESDFILVCQFSLENNCAIKRERSSYYYLKSNPLDY